MCANFVFLIDGEIGAVVNISVPLRKVLWELFIFLLAIAWLSQQA